MTDCIAGVGFDYWIRDTATISDHQVHLCESKDLTHWAAVLSKDAKCELVKGKEDKESAWVTFRTIVVDSLNQQIAPLFFPFSERVKHEDYIQVFCAFKDRKVVYRANEKKGIEMFEANARFNVEAALDLHEWKKFVGVNHLTQSGFSSNSLPEFIHKLKDCLETHPDSPHQ